MPKVTFEREDVVVEAGAGQTVLEVAEQAGISVFRGMWGGLHCNRVKGWCNRCKVWVKPSADGAINSPTGAERFPLRIGGAVGGTMRLACQVQVSGDITVHTRAGGPAVRPNSNWQPLPGPSKWKERFEKRHDKGGAPVDDEEAAAE